MGDLVTLNKTGDMAMNEAVVGTSISCEFPMAGPWEDRMTGWWFPIFFIFTPKIGEDSHFDSYFSKGLVQPPTR